MQMLAISLAYKHNKHKKKKQEWAKGSTKMNTLYLSETCFRVQAGAGQPDVAGVCSCAIEDKQ